MVNASNFPINLVKMKIILLTYRKEKLHLMHVRDLMLSRALLEIETDWILIDSAKNNHYHFFSNKDPNVLGYFYKTDISDMNSHTDIHLTSLCIGNPCDSFMKIIHIMIPKYKYIKLYTY